MSVFAGARADAKATTDWPGNGVLGSIAGGNLELMHGIIVVSLTAPAP